MPPISNTAPTASPSPGRWEGDGRGDRGEVPGGGALRPGRNPPPPVPVILTGDLPPVLRHNKTMPLADFHPAVASWFEKRFGSPTRPPPGSETCAAAPPDPQPPPGPETRAARHTLIAAPTGSGKTLAAFLA